MKIYTKTGDKGGTSLIGERTTKDDIRVDAYGEVDHLNSSLNFAMSISDEYNDILRRISNYLFTIGHDLSQCDNTKYKAVASEIKWLEDHIDTFTEKSEGFDHFVLPGGNMFASSIHICRTICRKCERKIVKVSKQFEVSDNVLMYINRLSDFLYALACYENMSKNVEMHPVKF